MAYTSAELEAEEQILYRLYFFFLMVWVGMIACAVVAIGG